MSLGFIVGAVLGSLRKGQQQAGHVVEELKTDSSALADRIKQQVHEAVAAARLASAEKEAELLKEYEDAKAAR
jgi:hypothetical protein